MTELQKNRGPLRLRSPQIGFEEAKLSIFLGALAQHPPLILKGNTIQFIFLERPTDLRAQLGHYGRVQKLASFPALENEVNLSEAR